MGRWCARRAVLSTWCAPQRSCRTLLLYTLVRIVAVVLTMSCYCCSDRHCYCHCCCCSYSCCCFRCRHYPSYCCNYCHCHRRRRRAWECASTPPVRAYASRSRTRHPSQLSRSRHTRRHEIGTLVLLHGHCWHRVLPINNSKRVSINFRSAPAGTPDDITDVCVYRNMRYRFSTSEVVQERV